jgi:hypothetical protein
MALGKPDGDDVATVQSGEEGADAPSAVFIRAPGRPPPVGAALTSGLGVCGGQDNYRAVQVSSGDHGLKSEQTLVLHVRLPRNALIVPARKSVRDVQVERRSAVEILSCAARRSRHSQRESQGDRGQAVISDQHYC